MVVLKPGNLNILAGTIMNRRKAMGMTQEELAEKSGISQVVISYIESGKRVPSVMQMVSVLSALDMSLKVE
jgi:transcriptional regulator with XRE-family HTH domain